MIKRLSFTLLFLVLFALPASAQDTAPVQVTQGDIQFSFAPDIALTVAVAQIDAVPLDANTPPGDENPAHTLFTFIGYNTGEGITPLLAPTIAVYETAGFEAAGWSDELSALRGLLDQRPDLSRQVGLPYLPQTGSIQVFTTRAEYVNFESGFGLRYLTTFAFDAAPVLEGTVLYTFQGMTLDESRVVAATFPINTGLLPAELADDFDYDAFIDSMDTYFADLLTELGGQDAAAFTPSLDALDALVSSLTVGDDRVTEADVIASAATATPDTVVAAVATATHTLAPTVEPTFTPKPTLSPFFEVEYGRFAYNVPYVLASDFTYAVIPGAANNPGTPLGDEHPSYVHFTFPTYTLKGSYPAALDFYLIEDDPGLFGFDGVVINLQTLLRDKPDLTTQTELPFPPLFTVKQGIQAKAQYMDFPSGTGVRYLTIYVQQDKPPIEGSVFYTFQGITTDERYLVSAIFPVDTALLQTEIQNFEINNFNTSSEGFYTDLERLLNEGGDVTPSLQVLDEMIQSITVGPKE